MKMNISNLEQNNKTAVNQIAEQQTEIEHLKSELVESRSQYKEAAQEVNEGIHSSYFHALNAVILYFWNEKLLPNNSSELTQSPR